MFLPDLPAVHTADREFGPSKVTTVLARPGASHAALGLDNGTVHLVALADGSDVRIIGDPGPAVTALAFDAQGDRLVVGVEPDPADEPRAPGASGTHIRVWSVETGMLLSQLDVPSSWVPPSAVAIDGERVAAALAGGGLVLWDGDEPARRVPAPRVDGLVFLGGQLLGIGRDGTLLAIDEPPPPSPAWPPAARLPLERTGTVGYWVSATGDRFAIGRTDGSIATWTRDGVATLLVGHDALPSAFAQAPGILLSGSLDGTVRAWALDDPPPLAASGSDPSTAIWRLTTADPVTGVAIDTATGSLLVVHERRTESWRLTAPASAREHDPLWPGEAGFGAFVGGPSGTVGRLDLASGQVTPLSPSIRMTCPEPDRCLTLDTASAPVSGSELAFAVASRRSYRWFAAEAPKPVQPDGSILGGVGWLWTEQDRPTPRRIDTAAPVWDATFSDDARLLAVSDLYGNVLVFDAESGSPVDAMGGRLGAPAGLAFARSSGAPVLYWADGDVIARWSPNAELAPLRTSRMFRGTFGLAIATTEDGALVAAANGRHVVVWDAVREVPLGTREAPEPVVALAFDRDGRRLGWIGPRAFGVWGQALDNRPTATVERLTSLGVQDMTLTPRRPGGG